jgi:glycolate oxidase FAD binding subunit
MDAAIPSGITMGSSTFEQAARAILARQHVRAAGPSDAVAGVQPQLVVEPGSEQELAKVLKLANEAGLAVIPRGGGTKLAWGNPPNRADLIQSTARLNRVLEHPWADMTVTVEAGCTIQTLQETLAQHGQRLALDPLWPSRATVGGVLSTNDSGVLRLRFGALRDLIIGVTLALPDGTLASSGGKVVKNVAGYDLPKLATGAFGTLGMITRAVFRLHPVPRNSQTFTILARDVDETQKLILAIQDSKLAHTAMQARFSADAPPQIDILFEGTKAGLAAQQIQVTMLAAQATLREVAPDVWNARQETCSLSKAHASDGSVVATVIAKLCILPASMAATLQCVARVANAPRLCWKAVMQATGIGCLRLAGTPEALPTALKSLRDHLEHAGGSLTMLEQVSLPAPFDAWGGIGDALPLMRAVKRQLDPKTTLNPGRFVGGI